MLFLSYMLENTNECFKLHKGMTFVFSAKFTIKVKKVNRCCMSCIWQKNNPNKTKQH